MTTALWALQNPLEDDHGRHDGDEFLDRKQLLEQARSLRNGGVGLGSNLKKTVPYIILYDR